MLKRIPVEERDRYIDGLRPEGKGIYFDKESIIACEDPLVGDVAISMVQNKTPGWDMLYQHGAGIVYYLEPAEKGRLYMMFGDPGTLGAPNRDSPVWMVWDVTDFPSQPARLVCFWWGNGRGKITAFIGAMVRFIMKFRPKFIGVDSTGPQKNAVTAINLHLRGGRITNPEILEWLGPDIPVGRKGVKIPEGTIISGMDFSVGKKNMYLFSGKMMIDSHKFSWPRIITGIRSQLGTYDPAMDRGSLPRFPQDIVSVVAMSAHAIQALFAIDLDTLQDEDEDLETPPNNVVNTVTREARWGAGAERLSR
jgi:hypothetical protein